MKSKTDQDRAFMRRAIALSEKGMRVGAGGPFGAVITKDDEIIAEGFNSVLATNDPTAHAEVVAIRKACEHLKDFQLTGCTIYTSCEPCPMCLGAIYWARPKRVFFACSRRDAANIDFDDDLIYEELDKAIGQRVIPFHPLLREEAVEVFDKWAALDTKTQY